MNAFNKNILPYRFKPLHAADSKKTVTLRWQLKN